MEMERMKIENISDMKAATAYKCRIGKNDTLWAVRRQGFIGTNDFTKTMIAPYSKKS